MGSNKTSGTSSGLVTAIGVVLGTAVVVMALAGAGILLSKLEDEGPAEQDRRGSEYLVVVESVYGDVTYGPDLDVNGNPTRTLHPEDREVSHQLWVDGEEIPVGPDQSTTDRVGTWRYEMLVPAGTSIRYRSIQQEDGLLMCSVSQDTLTMDLAIVEGRGIWCEVEYLVMGTVWP